MSAAEDRQHQPRHAHAADVSQPEGVVPEELEGELNVVLVGFEWWQQDLIDSWVPALEELIARRPGLQFYELVVVSRSR